MGTTNVPQRDWLALLLIVLAGTGVYAGTFQGPFVLDDNWAIVENSLIKNPAYLFSPSLWFQEYAGRLVALWTFALNYRIGGLDVTGYHVVNLLVHLTAASLVYTILRLTFRTPFFQLHGPRITDHEETPHTSLLTPHGL